MRIIIEVKGGVVQNVYSERPGLRYEILDRDEPPVGAAAEAWQDKLRQDAERLHEACCCSLLNKG